MGDWELAMVCTTRRWRCPVKMPKELQWTRPRLHLSSPSSCSRGEEKRSSRETMQLIRVLLVLCLTVPLALATDVNYCDKKTEYGVKVSGVEISPYPVVRGKAATFSISASTAEEISGGKMVIDVSYFGWHIHSETHDLCAETSCPVSTGDFMVAHSQVLPGYTPPGSYSLKMKMYDGNKKELTCIGFDFDIGLASSVADV